MVRRVTHSQARLVYDYTLLAIWQPEQSPPPTIAEAGQLISLLISWSKDKGSSSTRQAIIEMVRRWFPDWTGESLEDRFWRRKGRKNGKRKEEEPETSASETGQGELPLSSPAPASAPASEEKDEKPMPEPQKTDDPTLDAIIQLIRSGAENIWLYGPAGCGKTVLCDLAAKALDMPCTVLSCNAGIRVQDITGASYPQPEPSIFSLAIQQPGIIVLDEFPSIDPDMAPLLNSFLSTGALLSSVGLVHRHPDCQVIATGNTKGDTIDPMYPANQVIDAAGRDRFAGNYIAVDYNKDYERSHYCIQACSFVWAIRDLIKQYGWRQTASTRLIISAHQKIKSGIKDWQKMVVSQYSDQEQRAILEQVK